MIPRENENPRAVVGNNQPPSPIETLVAAQREAQTKERADRLAYIVEKANAKDVVDRETAGQAGDIIRVASQFEKVVEEDRVERTRPYREAADAAKAVCDEFLEPLRTAAENLRKRLGEWDKAEEKRIRDQAAEQDAFFRTSPGVAEQMNDAAPVATAKEEPAPVKPAKRRKITGDLGARVSTVEVKHYNVVDVHAVPDFIMQSATVKEAIVTVARSMAKHMPEIPGIEITTTTESRVR